jgi:hypothetical protein
MKPISVSNFPLGFCWVEGLEKMTWQPIETAPTDGTEIIVSGPYSQDVAIVRFERHDSSGDPKMARWACYSDGHHVIESESDFGTDYRYFEVPYWWQPAPIAKTDPA